MSGEIDSGVTKVFTTDLKRSTTLSTQKETILATAFGIVGGILLFCMVICICRKSRRQKPLKRDPSTSTVTTTTSPVYVIPADVEMRTPADVARRYRYQRSISQNRQSQIYLVPFSALPPDFDFSLRDIEVKADYVILKDLRLLESDSTINEPDTLEAYKKQDAYNPNVSAVYTNGSVHLDPSAQVAVSMEVYKKQSPYNPNFY